MTGTAYDPELFLEQEPLMEGQSDSPPRAALEVPVPLQRSRTEHESNLTADARQGMTTVNAVATKFHMSTEWHCLLRPAISIPTAN